MNQTPEETENKRHNLSPGCSTPTQFLAIPPSPGRSLDSSPFRSPSVQRNRFASGSPADTLEYSASEELTEGQPPLPAAIMKQFPCILTDSLAFSEDEQPVVPPNGGTPKRLKRRQPHSIQAIRKHFNLQNTGLRPGDSALSTFFDKADSSCVCQACSLF